MQDVIVAVVDASLFDGEDIERLLHHANDLRIAVRIAANSARIYFGDVMTGGTQHQARL